MIQRQLAERVVLIDNFSFSHSLGGMDVSNQLYDPQKMVYAAAVLLQTNPKIRRTRISCPGSSFSLYSRFFRFSERLPF